MMNFINFVLVVVCVAVANAADYPKNVTVEIECHELSVAAKWNKTDFGDGNITGIEWNDPSCTKFEESDTHVWAATNFSTCQSVINEYNDTIVQENTARVYVSFEVGLIQRVVVYNFLTKCQMLRVIHTPGSVSYNVEAKRIFGGNTTSTTDFSVRMDIYKDESFNEIMINTAVSSFDPIFIGIYEVNENQLLQFVAHQCYATPTSNRDDTSYKFFDDRCPIDKSFKHIPSPSNQYRFQIDAFRFIQLSKSIYIHCRLSVCKANSSSETCTQKKDCQQRKRRGISFDTVASDEPLEEITVMTQKLTFLKATCDEMPCPRYSSCVDLDPPVCRCGHGYVFKPEANLCSDGRAFTVSGLHFDMEFEAAFSDPYSKEFIRLANRIENQLNYFVSRLNDDTVEGVKVIRAREGSVVVDVDVIYAQTATQQEAFNTFLKSISRSHTETVDYSNVLKIKPLAPTVEESPTESPTILILSVVIPLVAVVIIIVAIAVVIRHRQLEPMK